jgi:hypothetical protein
MARATEGVRISGAIVRSRSSLLVSSLCAALGAVCIFALFDTAAQYSDFEIPQVGVFYIDDRELSFYVWYAFWGSLATGFFALALVRSGLAARLLDWVEQSLERPARPAIAAAVLTCCGAVGLYSVVLLRQPVTDDEMTYAFEAQTLVHGRVANPAPVEPAFLQNQFLILGERGWYGKYPIGHPLVLALGEAVGARWLVVPVLGLLSVLLTFSVGRILFGPKRAALAALLLSLSPQFVWTHATQLSQPTSALLMLAAMAATLQLRDDPRLRWALLAGVSWGFALLVRPMPAALFIVVAGVHSLVPSSASPGSWAARCKQLAALVPGLLLGAGALAWVNYLQSGTAFTSGYKSSGGGYGVLDHGAGWISLSVAGALLRQNFWLFGWTLSLAFVAFARTRRAALLFWGMIAADYTYRMLVPKTVVATTGPIYVFEVVPLLALASADGAARVGGFLQRIGVEHARAWVAGAMTAASVVALVTFVPIELSAIYRSSALRVRVYEALSQRRAGRALVFADELVNPERRATWAYYPPNPSPTFDDAVIFVRQPRGAGGPLAAHQYWRRRFPDRRAFLYLDAMDGPILEELRASAPPERTASLVGLAAARSGAAPP